MTTPHAHAPVDTIIHAATLHDHGTSTPNAWVAFSGGCVSHTGTGDSWREHAHPATRIHDAAGAHLTPGFIDMHVHGGAGHNFDDGAHTIPAVRDLHRRHGTTRLIVSLVTNPIDDIAARCRDIAAYAAGDPSVLGIHLEGPFLNPSHKGAHSEALLRPATESALRDLLTAAAGSLRQVTLAPELTGGKAAIGTLRAAGVAVAVGHTNATFEQAQAAFAEGAGILTHAFNGMNGIHHRAPGPVMAALGDDRVVLEVIADGVHVRPELIALLFAQAPGRVTLVTDAMAAAGVGDGEYQLGELAVRVDDGVARLVAGGSIAGSTLTLDEALRVTVAAGFHWWMPCKRSPKRPREPWGWLGVSVTSMRGSRPTRCCWTMRCG